MTEIQKAIDDFKRNELPDIIHSELMKYIVSDQKKQDQEIREQRSVSIIPRMLASWNQISINYPSDDSMDFPALSSIIKFIVAQDKINDQPPFSEVNKQRILEIWTELSKHVHGHTFYKTFSISQVSKHIQSIIQDYRHGKGSKSKFDEVRASSKINGLYSK